MSGNITAVKTNIITGFLGAGKTSAIVHLLKHKPADERWAVLVNEFGEVGIDGGLFTGQYSEASGIYVSEVTGGCMCCTAGLSMQIALTQLLKQSRPHRLLIEPTGLGHPQEVLSILQAENYQQVLDVQKVLTLVDARKLADKRYTEHEIFNQQIAIADVVIANKADLYESDELANLQNYLESSSKRSVEVITAEHGVFSIDKLDGKTCQGDLADDHSHSHHHAHDHTHEHSHSHADDGEHIVKATQYPECGYIKVVNNGSGFSSIGWQFQPEFVFSRQSLITCLQSMDCERLKAIFITDDGVFAYNIADNRLEESELDDCFDSRIEIIALELDESWEEKILGCVQ